MRNQSDTQLLVLFFLSGEQKKKKKNAAAVSKMSCQEQKLVGRVSPGRLEEVACSALCRNEAKQQRSRLKRMIYLLCL